ncbi:BCL2 associated agonist of cell death b isoform X1 [Labrus mixtus]|uniref:BCL2 associated agonist of cell death b isoform X1 n=2 Tax=Labrus mixtus TaxID=508554 RepID=UPI0029C09E31|nr:BCL2 associated agonist of cell death b isoform X1 [Labrus mixtus]
MTLTASDVTMAAKFTISDSESGSEEEVKEEENDRSSGVEEPHVPHRHSLTLPELRLTGTGRIRLNSESHAYTVSRDEELQARGEEEAGTPTEGAPFRGRSKSAPPALWAAKKYGRQLRRMSDEFDILLDKGEMKKVRSPGPAKQMHHSKSWWSYLFSHQETEGENNHHENHTHRNE